MCGSSSCTTVAVYRFKTLSSSFLEDQPRRFRYVFVQSSAGRGITLGIFDLHFAGMDGVLQVKG